MSIDDRGEYFRRYRHHFYEWFRNIKRVDANDFPDYPMVFQCFRTHYMSSFMNTKNMHDTSILMSILFNTEERRVAGTYASFCFSGFYSRHGRYPSPDDNIVIQYVKWFTPMYSDFGNRFNTPVYYETWCRWALDGDFEYDIKPIIKNDFKVPYFLQDF